MYSESFRTISSCFALLYFVSELFIQLTQYSALICYRGLSLFMLISQEWCQMLLFVSFGGAFGIYKYLNV